MNQLRKTLLNQREEDRLRRQYKIHYDSLEYKKVQLMKILESEVRFVRNLERRRILKIRAESKSSLNQTKQFHLLQKAREDAARSEANSWITQLQKSYYNEVQEITGWQRAMLTELNSSLFALNTPRDKIENNAAKAIDSIDSIDAMDASDNRRLSIAWNGNDVIDELSNESDGSDASEGSEASEESVDSVESVGSHGSHGSDAMGSDSENENKENNQDMDDMEKFECEECVGHEIECNLNVLNEACDKVLSQIGAKINEWGSKGSKGSKGSVGSKCTQLQNKLSRIAGILSQGQQTNQKIENKGKSQMKQSNRFAFDDVESTSGNTSGSGRRSSASSRCSASSASSASSLGRMASLGSVASVESVSEEKSGSLDVLYNGREQVSGSTGKDVDMELKELKESMEAEMKAAILEATEKCEKEGKRLTFSMMSKIKRQVREKYGFGGFGGHNNILSKEKLKLKN